MAVGGAKRYLLAVAASAATLSVPPTKPSEHQAPPSSSTPQLLPPLVASWTQLSKADFLRPEAVETLFYLWRATGDDIYREWGWNMFRAFERYCRLGTGGYATVADVNQVRRGMSAGPVVCGTGRIGLVAKHVHNGPATGG